MPKNSGSTWTAELSLATFPKLAADLKTDVAVIGGGITGMLTAYRLAKHGYQVALLEKDRLLAGATSYTTGFITQSIDTDTGDLIDMFEVEGARMIWESHGAGRDLLQQIAREEGIECEYKRVPNYLYANDRKELKSLKEEYSALRRISARVNLLTDPVKGFKNAGAIIMPNQAKFDPAKFLMGIVGKLKEMDVLIYEKTEVTEIRGTTRLRITAGGHAVSADWSIMATYGTDDRYKELYFKKGMYKSYIMELEAPPGTCIEGTYEDMDNPYHYFRIDSYEDRDRILIGGEDHRVELKMDEKKNFDALRDYAKEIFGQSYPEVRRWAGNVLEPIDGLALIGEAAPHQLVATSFSGNGMTYAAIASLLLTDLVEGKKNPWKYLYDPKRMPSFTQLWKKGRDYSEEFFRGAVANALKQRK